MDKTNLTTCTMYSVVEPFHFDPAPAQASQDAGSGSSSSYSNSSTLYSVQYSPELLAVNKICDKFTFYLFHSQIGM